MDDMRKQTDADGCTPSQRPRGGSARYSLFSGILAGSWRVIAWQRFLTFDLLLTALACCGWWWFARQYGLENSPDSWYRGVLGKSIAEGHPYYINLKQGYIYDFGVWHHDATQAPLLPLLYAIFFKVFGYRIIIANIISTMSAGLLMLPLLRLCRHLLGTPLPAFVIYAAVVFTEKVNYLFEVTAGLSFPTTLLAFTSFLICLAGVLESRHRRFLLGAILASVAYYYVRNAEQLIFFWLMLWTLLLVRCLHDRAILMRVRTLWMFATLCIMPWFVRQIILFKSPFFTHMSGELWTDRSYDYYDYHETMPFPTRATYFVTHTWQDLLDKVFVSGVGNVYHQFDNFTFGPFWVYILLTALAAIVIQVALTDARKKFLYGLLWLVFLAYCGIYDLAAVAHTRHYIPPFFILVFTLVSGPVVLSGRLLGGWKHQVVSGLICLLLGAGVAFSQKDFWKDLRGKYLIHSYSSADRTMANDKQVQFLKEHVGKQDVILAPFAEGQRLAFATGLSFIEKPANYDDLNDPVAFFRKYNIRYSLVDVRRRLPKSMVEAMIPVGNGMLFTIRQDGGHEAVSPFRDVNLIDDSAVRSAISAGLAKRIFYVDGFHGVIPSGCGVLQELGMTVYRCQGNFISNREKLMQSGVLVISYEQNKPSPSEEEYGILKQYIANGGRLLLLCPAWVWVAYEKHPLDELPYNRIIKPYEVLLTGAYAVAPLRVGDARFSAPGVEKQLSGAYSILSVPPDLAHAILVDSAGNIAAAGAEKEHSRLVVFGHGELLTSGALETKEARQFAKNICDWLLEP